MFQLLRMKGRDDVRQGGDDSVGDPPQVRAIPGGVSRSPLESRVQEILAARPACAWDHLVAEVARYLRRSEDPRVLAVLDEGFWGGWVWRAFAQRELRRLDGVLLAIEARPSPVADIRRPDPGREPAGSQDLSAVNYGE